VAHRYRQRGGGMRAGFGSGVEDRQLHLFLVDDG
jgi:hypothetical protein